MPSKIIRSIRKALKELSTPEAKESMQRFFKEKVKGYGVKSPDTNRLANKTYSEIKQLGKSAVFAVADELMRSGYIEERIIAAHWAEKLSRSFEEKDFKRLEKWVSEYISNWAECDTLCNHAVGDFLMKYPSYIKELKKWARSKNRWVKRASAVTLIIPARRGLFLPDILEIADILMADKDDMVQKGYGWMLKAASEAHEKEIFEFVLKHRLAMPRTALRYAIEKMSASKRKEAMKV